MNTAVELAHSDGSTKKVGATPDNVFDDADVFFSFSVNSRSLSPSLFLRLRIAQEPPAVSVTGNVRGCIIEGYKVDSRD